MVTPGSGKSGFDTLLHLWGTDHSKPDLIMLYAGVTTPPVKVLTEEPMNNLLPAAAYANLKQPLPLQDPQLAILKWTLSNCL